MNSLFCFSITLTVASVCGALSQKGDTSHAQLKDDHH